MSIVSAPSRLMLAPRPLSCELISSWLLRVAASHHTSLEQLLDAFKAHYPEHIPSGTVVDYDLPPAAIHALARFCRAPVKAIQRLDLRQRAPHLEPAFILRFQPPRWNGGAARQRVRYAFCPLCLASQSVTHIPWQWSLACVTFCSVHHTPLRDGCPECGEPDPVSFTALGEPWNRICWSCAADLTRQANAPVAPSTIISIRAVEDAYREAILGIAPDPRLLGKTTDRAFRMFICDLLQTLCRVAATNSAAPEFADYPGVVPRQAVLRIITELISYAVPSSNARQRQRRSARSSASWASLLTLMTNSEGAALERASQRWPLTLRRRFESSLRHRKQQRWPHSPFQGQSLSARFKRSAIAAMADLSATTRVQKGESQI